jgi:hypothetical protein
LLQVVAVVVVVLVFLTVMVVEAVLADTEPQLLYVVEELH